MSTDKRIEELNKRIQMGWLSTNEQMEIITKMYIYKNFPELNEGDFLFSLLYIIHRSMPFIMLIGIIAILLLCLFGAVCFTLLIFGLTGSILISVSYLLLYILTLAVIYDWCKRKIEVKKRLKIVN
jgi:hypothetical protein